MVRCPIRFVLLRLAGCALRVGVCRRLICRSGASASAAALLVDGICLRRILAGGAGHPSIILRQGGFRVSSRDRRQGRGHRHLALHVALRSCHADRLGGVHLIDCLVGNHPRYLMRLGAVLPCDLSQAGRAIFFRGQFACKILHSGVDRQRSGGNSSSVICFSPGCPIIGHGSWVIDLDSASGTGIIGIFIADWRPHRRPASRQGHLTGNNDRSEGRPCVPPIRPDWLSAGRDPSGR